MDFPTPSSNSRCSSCPPEASCTSSCLQGKVNAPCIFRTVSCHHQYKWQPCKVEHPSLNRVTAELCRSNRCTLHGNTLALMVVTSVCSFWADYVQAEEPDHVIHQIDRVVAFVSVACLSYSSLFILGLPFMYCFCALAGAVLLFLLSRSRKRRSEWVICHTLWHVVPLLLIFTPGMLGLCP
mmetsp:Transcript_151920/g.487578  ORF Transcript_151920/g.487578 Transcript_151920/m.487578 type:complete len:181 (-) Transcript_151920:67-609(-)